MSLSIRLRPLVSAMLWAVCLGPALSGCGKSALTHYYTLTPQQAAPEAGPAPAGVEAPAASAPGTAKGAVSGGGKKAAPMAAVGKGAAPGQGPCYSLGIGPVDFPAYLDRTQIVTQSAGNQMQLADFDQWVEPIQENFKRVLMENLATGMCAQPLVLSPWPVGVRPEYQVAIQVQRFDGVLGQEAVLRTNWSILNAAGDVLVWRTTALREPVAGPGYAALAAAQSVLVARFGQELATTVSALKP